MSMGYSQMNGVQVGFWCAVGFIVYTYVVYPVMVTILGSMRRRESFRNGTLPTASVVLVVRNEAARIRARIDNLLIQEPDRVVQEIVVVSDASDDGTDDIVNEIAEYDYRVRLLRLTLRMGKAAGVDRGVSVASGEVVVFADARQEFEPGTVAALLSHFADPKVGAVAGELRFREQKRGGNVAKSLGFYWRYETWIRQSEAAYDSVMGCSGAVYSARRALIGPVPPGLILDDMWIPLHVIMAGSRVAYEPRAVAWDEVQESANGEFQRKVRTLAGNFQLVALRPALLLPWRYRLWWCFVSHKLFRLFVPYALIGLLILSLLEEGFIYRGALFAQLIFYGLGIVGFFTSKGDKQGWKCRVCTFVHVFVVLNAAAVAGAIAYFTGRYRHLWVR